MNRLTGSAATYYTLLAAAHDAALEAAVHAAKNKLDGNLDGNSELLKIVGRLRAMQDALNWDTEIVWVVAKNGFLKKMKGEMK